MFLTANEYDISDFLKAIGFVAPKNFNVEYFISPEEGLTDDTIGQITDSGFTDESESPAVKSPGIKYFKRDPKTTHCFSKQPDEDFNMPAQYPVSMEGPNDNGQEYADSVTVKSPYKAIKVLESSKTEETLMLKENLGGVPRNSIVHLIAKE